MNISLNAIYRKALQDNENFSFIKQTFVKKKYSKSLQQRRFLFCVSNETEEDKKIKKKERYLNPFNFNVYAFSTTREPIEKVTL